MGYTFKIVKDREVAEELVQETFVKLWEKLEDVQQEAAIKSYLFIILKNKIIDFHRKNRMRAKNTKEYVSRKDVQVDLENEWELTQQIDKINRSLPAKTLEIFQLSRQERLTYAEISQRMSISVKTVEAHISQALTAFRSGLKDYL